MSALKVFQIDGVTLYAVENPHVVAAMMAFDYAWQEVPDSPEKFAAVLRNLGGLYDELVALTPPTGGSPKPQRSPATRARTRSAGRSNSRSSSEQPAAPA